MPSSLESTSVNALTNFIREHEERKLKQAKPFPLIALLKLYTRQHKVLYVDHFAAFKAFAKFLAPFEIPSWCKPKPVIHTLYNYEQQEIAVILGLHPSIIQQLFIHIEFNLGDCNGHSTS